MKKRIALALVMVMAFSLSACSRSGDMATPGTNADPASPDANNMDASDVTVGACIFKFDNTFMTLVRNGMEEEANQLGTNFEAVDGQDQQPLQNEQVDTYITKGVDALIVNPVDRTSSGPLIEKAKSEGIPIVFVNREPTEEDLAGYEKAWYVGSPAIEAGYIQGELIVDLYKNNPDADKNGDGKVQMLLLEGEMGHQDTIARTEGSLKKLDELGLEYEILSQGVANWGKSEAYDLVKTMISSVGIDNIEVILCNNDDMALGALEALKGEGYNSGDSNKFISIIGVDATTPALEAMEKGELYATVLQDANNQGKICSRLAYYNVVGTPVNNETMGYDVDGNYIWVPYVAVTLDNYTEFM